MDDEEWRTIEEFPNYRINNYGEIYNNRTRRLMRTSYSNFGHSKVTLKNGSGRHTRSVALLVAQTFVDAPDILCDFLVVLDGNFANVCADNLAWRPRGFAWEYTRQLKIEQPDHFYNLPVRNVDTNVKYRAIVEAGIIEGVLFKEIWRSTFQGNRVYPHGHRYEVVAKR